MTERLRAQQARFRAGAAPVYDWLTQPQGVTEMTQPRMNRRDALLAALTVGAGMAVSRTALSAGAGATLTKAIPSSGQKVPGHRRRHQ